MWYHYDVLVCVGLCPHEATVLKIKCIYKEYEMITVSNLGMQFGGQWLFQHVDLQFLPGNCYGIIGANGAGKSTFLRILTGELDNTTGSVSVDPDKRVSVLKQNQNAYDEYTVMDTVIMGNQHLYDVMKEKDAIYEKPDFSDEDGLRAADLEAEFAELGGWEAAFIFTIN